MSKTSTLLQKLAQEPTVHFFAIAALLFGVYAINQSGQDNVLEIAQSDIDARIFLQEINSGQPLTDAQREYITARYIEEQILVREALAMNLDDDARIHDMLAQKMRHVLSGDVIQPTDAELQAYYNANLERYRSEATITSDELVFDTTAPLPDDVTAQLQAGADPAVLLDLIPGNVAPLRNANYTDLANIFAPEFADRVFAANIGDWVGPFPSNRGQHWLRVREHSPSRTPDLAEIVDRVRLDWIGAEEDNRLQQQINTLWESYSIVITDAEQ